MGPCLERIIDLVYQEEEGGLSFHRVKEECVSHAHHLPSTCQYSPASVNKWTRAANPPEKGIVARNTPIRHDDLAPGKLLRLAEVLNGGEGNLEWTKWEIMRVSCGPKITCSSGSFRVSISFLLQDSYRKQSQLES